MALTANQIVTLVTQSLKVPGFVSQAQQLLNVVLADLADTQDLDLCRGIYTGITLAVDNGSGNGSGPYLLPLDYKRAERDGVWYKYDGVPYKLISIDLSEFFDQVQQAGIANFPEFYATDTSPLGQEPPTAPLIYVWPPASFATTLFVQYRRLLPDISYTVSTAGNEIPWFPNQDYLLLMLKAQLADVVDDSRADDFRQKALAQLDRFMKLTNDDEGRAKTITRDRRRFGNSYSQLPDTKTIGWTLFPILIGLSSALGIC